MKKKIQIIAEAGPNHNGQIKLAYDLVDVAASAGADIVKFQTAKSENLISKNAPKAEYQKKYTIKNESQLEMGKKLDLDYNAHVKIIKHCNNKKIKFLSSPFDLDSIDILVKLGLKTLKIPSGSVTDLPYLRKIGSLNKKIIISSGMSNLKEIINAYNILISSGTDRNNIVVLHCNTEYPTPMDDVNLKAMLTIRDELGVAVGYSDHTLGIEVPTAAAALGATIIEKHFTLDRTLPGPDHCASLEPPELRSMVNAIRNIEKAMGNSIKQPSQSERKNILIVRKSIVAAQKIIKGETLNERNLTTKRPGTGISPMRWDEIIGKVATKNYQTDDFITD